MEAEEEHLMRTFWMIRYPKWVHRRCSEAKKRQDEMQDGEGTAAEKPNPRMKTSYVLSNERDLREAGENLQEAWGTSQM